MEELANLTGIPGLAPAVSVLVKFCQAVENMKVYKNQCKHLRDECTDLLLVLRDNAERMVGTDYIKALDEAEFTMERIYKKVHTWSTWSKPKALLYQSEIKNGLDESKRDIVHCVSRFNMRSQMETLHTQRNMRMGLRANHAEIQEKLQKLLESTQDIHNILKQPEHSITHHMMNIQEAIHANIAEPEQQHSLQARLLKIHRKTELLPPMIDLTGEVRRIEEHPVNISGAYSDVYLGKWLGDEKVALKLTRGLNHTPKAQKRFIKEMALWRQLQHKNVARLYGVATLGNHIYAVSPWMEHRDALSYVEKNPDADRVKILCEVATGLEFLHKHGVVHGDLRGANILISDSEVACITDFGLSVILEEEADAPSDSATIDNHGNCRWMSPELVQPELIGLQVAKPNTATDVWSYGMLCLEVLTGQRPFHNRPRAAAVISDLINGVRPTRPSADVTRRGLSDALWDLMQKCWHQSPELRPSMSDILEQMKPFQVGPRVSTNASSPRLPPTLVIDSATDASSSRVLDDSSPFRSSPRIPILTESNQSGIPSVSPVSITSSSSQSVSPGHSLRRPSTGGSNVSSAGNFVNASPRIKGFGSIPPSRDIVNHGKSVSLGVVPSQGKYKINSVRPSTAEGIPPRLPHIGEFQHESHAEGLGDFLSYIRPDVSRPIENPTVQLQRTSAPEPPAIASSLPSSFVAPTEHSPSRPTFDVAPSEYSENVSMASGHSPTASANDEAPTPRPLHIKYGFEGIVEAATLPSLVERLISDSTDFRKDVQFRETFLTSYQAFTNAEEVFNLLLERFEAVSSNNHTPAQRASVRYSVLTVLDLWLHSHHIEVNDRVLLERMRGFAISIQHSSPAPTLGASAQRLTALIDTMANNIASSPVPPLSPSLSSPGLTSALTPSELSEKDFALALTILESDRYQKIIPSDCICWVKGIRNSNGISQFNAENNKLSYWVQKSILKPNEQSQRSDNLKYFICVAEECRILRNFSSTCALLAGITSSFITGLKRTSNLDKSHAKMLAEAQKLMVPAKNFQAYRNALNASQEPCVPWLHVHLRDVKAVHDSHRTFINQDGHRDVINFGHYYRVHERIRHILSYQNNPPELIESGRQHEILVFLNTQLQKFTINDAFRNWLQERATNLGHQEQADFASHRKELVHTGFLRR